MNEQKKLKLPWSNKKLDASLSQYVQKVAKMNKIENQNFWNIVQKALLKEIFGYPQRTKTNQD